MSLNDVWRNLNDELGIFWKGRFDLVPAAPGVYAWFYPLRITSFDLNVFLRDIAKVFTFDARTNGPASLSFVDRLAWETVEIALAMRPTNAPLSGDIVNTWQRAIANPDRFQHLRRIVMKGSILMPPPVRWQDSVAECSLSAAPRRRRLIHLQSSLHHFRPT